MIELYKDSKHGLTWVALVPQVITGQIKFNYLDNTHSDCASEQLVSEIMFAICSSYLVFKGIREFLFRNLEMVITIYLKLF